MNKKITDKVILIQHDTDGVTRDFHGYAEKLFNENYPEYKKYKVSPDEIRGWQFEDEYWPLVKAKEVDKIMTEMFFGGKYTYEVFRNAPSLVSPDRWEAHINELKTAFPNCRIVMSTHQYTNESKVASVEWYGENQIEYDDLIFTDKKDLYNPDYLLDDKPQTIETINNNKNGHLGVLFKRERSNGWYIRSNKYINFPIVNTIEEYRNIILDREGFVAKYKYNF